MRSSRLSIERPSPSSTATTRPRSTARSKPPQRLFADRRVWLKSHKRIDILRKLAKREHLGRQIAREGGKPLTDALIEADRAIDGVQNAPTSCASWLAG